MRTRTGEPVVNRTPHRRGTTLTEQVAPPATSPPPHYVVRHYDNGWSHEKGTMTAEGWSAEDIERMRLEQLVRANGADKVTEMVRRGTWPVDA